MNKWNVYIVKCSDSSYYTGITKDLARRMDEHNNGDIKCARYTRSRRPVHLVYYESLKSRSEACKRESQIKRLSRKDKEIIIAQSQAPTSDLI